MITGILTILRQLRYSSKDLIMEPEVDAGSREFLGREQRERAT